MLKRKVLSVVLSSLMLASAIFAPTRAFAADYEGIPEGADVRDLVYEEGTNDSNQIVPYNTVTGSAGKSWVYLNGVSRLKSQAAFGISCTKRMDGLTWNLTYSDGKSKSSWAAPFSKDWSNEHVQTHNSSGTKTVTLSVTAVNVNGQVMVSLMPTSAAYIY